MDYSKFDYNQRVVMLSLYHEFGERTACRGQEFWRRLTTKIKDDESMSDLEDIGVEEVKSVVQYFLSRSRDMLTDDERYYELFGTNPGDAEGDSDMEENEEEGEDGEDDYDYI